MVSNYPAATSFPPFDVTVIIPTVLRPCLLHAVRSIFEQDFAGRIQIMVGVDLPLGDVSILDRLVQECPPTMHVTAINPSYSTAGTHGGLHFCWGGGALRTLMSFASHGYHLAYLDDDNWVMPNHLTSLMDAVVGCDFAYTRRHVVDPRVEEPITTDTHDSRGIGPWRGPWKSPDECGVFFVDTNSLLLNKMRCQEVFPLWMKPLSDNGIGEDRSVTRWLFDHRKGAPTGLATTLYRIDPRAADSFIQVRRKNQNPWPWEQAMQSPESRHQHLVKTLTAQTSILHLDPKANTKSPISPNVTNAIMSVTGATTALVLRDRGAALARSLARSLAQADNRAGAFIGVDTDCGDLTNLRQADPALAKPRAVKTIRAEQTGDRTTTTSLFFLPQSPAIAMRYFACHHLAFDLIMLAPITIDDHNYSTKLIHQAWRLLPAGGSLAAVDAIAIKALKYFAMGVVGQLIGDEQQAEWLILRKQAAA